MIILIHGTDIVRARKKFSGLLDSLVKKHKDASLFVAGSDDFSPARFEEFISGQTLFYNKFVVGCDNLLGNKEAVEFVGERLKEIKESPNVFVFLEKDLDKDLGGRLKRSAEQVSEYESKAVKAPEKFNIFSLTDAFGRRDKQLLWILMQKALRAGVAAEEIFWKFSWVATNILAVKKSKKPEDLGFKPYVLSTARSFGRNFSTEEMEKISSDLISIYDRCRSGEGEFEIELEKMVFGL